MVFMTMLSKPEGIPIKFSPRVWTQPEENQLDSDDFR